MLTQPVARKRGALHPEDACALVNTSWQLVVDTESGVTEQRGVVGALQHVTLCE